ncbi:MAG: hypothetical protein KY467_17650 [Gemmatimonadetes bacterium]|nr:hypothetical protein [Gemmatimonadota bacterium]
MRLLYVALAALFALAPSGRGAAQAFPLDSVRAILPPGTLRVDAMDLAPSPRMTELSQKLQAAIQQNAAWFQQHVRSATPGEPLPYDTRLGLTREEYDEFLRLAGSMELKKVAEAPLVVRGQGERLVFDGGTGMPDLTGVAIDLAADQLVMPLGTVTGSREVHSDGAGAAMGPWHGRTWSLEEMSEDGRDGRVVSLSVGRLRESGRGVIHTQMRQVQDGRQIARMVRILFFDVPR